LAEEINKDIQDEQDFLNTIILNTHTIFYLPPHFVMEDMKRGERYPFAELRIQ